jgi:choline dehydrogenase
MRTSLLAATGFVALATATYYDSLTGYSLLGSHFGVPGFDATFDYVIVGGGTAGLAIATRLSQQGNQVAVVEAGGFYEMDNGNLTQIPGKAAYFIGKDPVLRNPNIDWGLETVPQVVYNESTLAINIADTNTGAQ